MKKLVLVAVGTLSVAFLASVAFSFVFLSGLDQIWTTHSQPGPVGRTVAVLLPAERDPFWDDLVVSLRRLGSRSGIGFEVTRYNLSGTNAREVLEKIVLSKVDAVLCYPPESVDVVDVVNDAEASGLRVLLLENDLPTTHRSVFFAASAFQVGQEVGRRIRELPQRVDRVGVLLSQVNRDRQTVKNSLFMNGLNEGLTRMPQQVSLLEVISPPGRFAGEELVWNLLRREPAVQVLVTTNSKDTSSALQTIVEANKVGRVKLVGVGEDAGLKAALAQGLIEGLIERDSAAWAASIAATMEALLKGETVSSYVNLPVRTLTKPEVDRGL